MKKAQFNVKEAKEFRTIMAKWADAHGALNEKILSKQDFVKARKTMMASNQDAIDGKTTLIGKSVADLVAENQRYQSEIEKASVELAEFRKAQADRVNPALALVGDSLYKAYATAVMDGEDTDKVVAYAAEIDIFFATNGVVSGEATVNALMGKTGADRASARYEYKNGTATKAMAKAKFKDLFIRSLCDIMRQAQALPEYKYSYVPMAEREKKNK